MNDEEYRKAIEEVRKKSPQEQANFRKGVFRYLEEIPMRMMLKDVNRKMEAGDWLRVRSWVMGITEDKPDFVMDGEPGSPPGSIEGVRLALRNVMEINHF